MKNGKDTENEIIKIMQRIGKPAIINHIAVKSRIAPQLVDYTLEKMIKKGIARTLEVEGKTYYTLQFIFYDRNWLAALYKQLTPFIKDMNDERQITLDQIEEKPEKAIINIITAFLKRFEEEIESGKLFK